MATTNIINAVFGSGLCAVTTSAFRANYGMVLRFSGIDLPTAFECDFSNYDVMGRDSITMIGQNNEVQIPDDLWDGGMNIYAYVYLHPTDDSGVTVYTVTIPVLGRPNRTEEQPTPHEQTVIEQAISALNDAVEQTAADVETTTANAQAAAQSEANAATSERSAAASAGAALASQNAAESASQSATESASGAAESATNAQESAEQAERSVQSISGDVERAERAAATATEKATEAGQSATAAAASASAALASQNAAHASETASAQSASSAASAAQNAASSAQSAESSATDAEQAKLDAQSAQAAAEQAAESVSGLSEQIAQNTSDIAELVQSKAGVLVDTATGSIASFVPDSTVPTVKGLTVDVEPVQDLHGYDNPWPGGGGKNLLFAGAVNETRSGITFTTIGDGSSFIVSGTAKGNVALTIPTGAKAPNKLQSGVTYTLSGGHWANTGVAYIQLVYKGDTTGDTISIVSSASTATKTMSEDATLTGIYINFISGNTFTNDIVQPQFEVGSSATSFAPYSNICPISGWDSVDVQRTAINVWDEEMESGRISATGQPYAEASWIRTKNFISIKPNTAYYRVSPNNIQLFWYDEEQNFISYANWGKGTITSPSNAYYMKFHVDPSYGTIYNNDISINYPSTATAYTPYQGDTYTIQLGQTVYGCKLYATQGKMVVDRAMDTFDGDEYWYAYDPENYDSYCFVTDGPNKKIQKLTSISNMYKNVENAWGYGGNGKYAVFSDHVTLARWYFTRPNEAFEKDVSAWKAWLAENPLQVCYELATPITIDLTPLEISVLTGQTNNIWADCGDVSVEYAADLKTYIDQKIAAAVAALS